jgi:hypothetical protein
MVVVSSWEVGDGWDAFHENEEFRLLCLHSVVVVEACYLLAAVAAAGAVAVTVAAPYSYVEHFGLLTTEKPLLRLQLQLP